MQETKTDNVKKQEKDTRQQSKADTKKKLTTKAVNVTKNVFKKMYSKMEEDFGKRGKYVTIFKWTFIILLSLYIFLVVLDSCIWTFNKNYNFSISNTILKYLTYLWGGLQFIIYSYVVYNDWNRRYIKMEEFENKEQRLMSVYRTLLFWICLIGLIEKIYYFAIWYRKRE